MGALPPLHSSLPIFFMSRHVPASLMWNKPSVPCSAPVANTVITFTRAGITRSARTDLHGRYKIELPAGYYVIGTQVLMVGPPLRPAKVHVRAAHADEIDFTIDTGIR